MTRSPTPMRPLGRYEAVRVCAVTTSSTSPMSCEKTRRNVVVSRPLALPTFRPCARRAVASSAAVKLGFESLQAARKRRQTAPLVRSRTSRNSTERLAEELVLLGRSDRHADRPRSAEACGRPHDHALAQELLEERARVVADLGEQEVRD